MSAVTVEASMICAEAIPSAPASAATAGWAEGDELPVVLVPFEVAKDGTIRPGRFYDETGRVFSARDVETILFQVSASQDAMMSRRNAQDVRAAAATEIGSTLALGGGSFGNQTERIEANAQTLRDVAGVPEDAYSRSICAYNRYRAAELANAAAQAAFERDVAAASTGGGAPPMSAWVVTESLYAGSGRTRPADAAAWRADVTAVYAWLSAGKSTEAVLAAITTDPVAPIATILR